jgi:hypothetical protein
VKDFETFVEKSSHNAISDNEFGSAGYKLKAAGKWKKAGDHGVIRAFLRIVGYLVCNRNSSSTAHAYQFIKTFI